MIAIPLDNEHTTTLSKLYGKAPYFALLDEATGEFSIIENEVKGQGPKSADFLKTHGATSTVYYHMGEGVYKSFEKNSMDVYCADYNEYSIDEIYTNFLNENMTKLTKENFEKLLDPGEGETCKCGCND
jgi:predicted Fe-Mo cluster-binding NifX family protein